MRIKIQKKKGNNKIIHQIFLDVGLLPLEERIDYLENMESIKNKNPTWKYILWNEIELDNFVEKYYPQYLQYWNSFPHKFYKIDYARYLLLQKYGGIYIDLDEHCIKSFDNDILKSKVISGSWWDKRKDNEEVKNNNNIMAINNPKLIENLIQYCNGQIEEKRKTLPSTWRCRLFQHSVSQRMFTRWCKLNKIKSDININNYLITQTYKPCSWITSMGKKVT